MAAKVVFLRGTQNAERKTLNAERKTRNAKRETQNAERSTQLPTEVFAVSIKRQALYVTCTVKA
jgi:hypothetical protein